MRKGYALGFVILFLLTSCMIAAKPVSADQAVGNMWAELAPMNLARSYFGAVVLDGKIYAIGGCDQVATGGSEIMPASSYTGGVIGTNEVYDPNANNWTSEAPMPTPREGFAIAVYQGEIYCIGGSTQSPPYGWGGAIGVNEMYDPSTNKWQEEAPMPYPVSGLQANVVDGKIYCIGGIEASGTGSQANQVYDPATNTWSENAPIPTSTFGYATATFDGKIYIINGIDWYSMYGLDITQIYNPQNNTWSLGAPPPHPAKGFEEETEGNYVGAATTGVMAPERIYAIGSSYTQIYDPMTNSWSLGEAISPSRDGFAVANVNDVLYVMGGSTFTGDLNAEVATETEFSLTQEYTPVGYGTPDPSYIIEHTPPQIILQSPLNQTYNNSSVPLIFAVNKAINWTGYNFNGRQNITVTGNCTISNIPNGKYNITVYANDTFGNTGYSTVDFTIAKQKPFQILDLVAVSVAVAVVVVAVLLVYFKKRKY